MPVGAFETNVAAPVITGVFACIHSAVIAVVPAPFSTANPEALTVATVTSLDTQFR